MNQTHSICNMAGKMQVCQKCPYSKSHPTISIPTVCPQDKKVIYGLTKIFGSIHRINGKWRFVTNERMLIDLPATNHTASKAFDPVLDNGKPCVAWVTEKEIQILRINIKGKLIKLGYKI